MGGAKQELISEPLQPVNAIHLPDNFCGIELDVKDMAIVQVFELADEFPSVLLTTD